MNRPDIYKDVIKKFPNKSSYEQRDMHIQNQDRYIDYLENELNQLTKQDER